MNPKMKTLLKIGFIASTVVAFGASAAPDATGIANNTTGFVSAGVNMLLGLGALGGVGFALSGISGLQKKQQGNGETALDHWKKIGVGSALFGVLGILLAFNTEMFNDSGSNFQETQTIISGGTTS